MGLILAAAAAVAPASRPAELAPVGYGWALFKMLAALVVVCALAYVVLHWLRRHLTDARLKASGQLHVVDRRPLDAKHSLWLVEAGGRTFLLGTSDAAGGGVTRIAELESLPPPAPPEAARRRTFREWLERAKGRGRAGGGA